MRGNSEAVLAPQGFGQGKSESNTVLLSNKLVGNKHKLIAQASQNSNFASMTGHIVPTTTEVNSRISEGAFHDRASPLQTHATNFMTEKVSNPSRRIVQTQENIILSQNSSIKNLEWSNGATRNNIGGALTVLEDKIILYRRGMS